MPQPLDAFSRGVFAGAIATGPMTLALFESFRRLPRSEKSPLPPATLTYESLKPENETFEAWSTMAAHFAYGAGTGALYSVTMAKLEVNPVLKGTAYGLLVWAGSYMGWTPALGFRARATNMSTKRNAMMIAAHVVWGASLAYADERMRTEGLTMLAGHKKAVAAE